MYKKFFPILLLLAGFQANAAIIQIDVIDPTNIVLSLSGTINGPVPADNLGILFIDTPVPTSVSSSSSSITGDAMIGGLSIHSVFSGFNNAPYGGSLQIRGSINGVTPFMIGDVLSGTANISFHSDHGMTQAMFDGIGHAIYWGRNSISVGTLQGSATSFDSTTLSTVPIPGAAWLFGTALLGFIGYSRRRNLA